MNKEYIVKIAEEQFTEGVISVDSEVLDFAESLLKAYHVECLMRLNKELDKYTFMGKEWHIIHECQSALTELVPHNLNNLDGEDL